MMPRPDPSLMEGAVADDTRPGPLAQREVRRQAKSRHIIDVAKALVLEDGIGGASIDRIVERARVSKRTVYARFANKDDIFAALISSEFAAFFEAFDATSAAGGDLIAGLKAISRELLQMANQPLIVALFRSLGTVAQSLPLAVQNTVSGSHARFITALSALLQRMVEKGSHDIPDIGGAAEFYLDILLGTEYQRVLVGLAPALDAAQIDRRVTRAVEHFDQRYRVR
jgi:AcrR family transcriptional regulator